MSRPRPVAEIILAVRFPPANLSPNTTHARISPIALARLAVPRHSRTLAGRAFVDCRSVPPSSDHGTIRPENERVINGVPEPLRRLKGSEALAWGGDVTGEELEGGGLNWTARLDVVCPRFPREY